MHTVIDEVLTNYEVYGSPKKQEILIIHGWGRNLTDWEEISQELAKDHKIILIDLPGFGESSQPKKALDTYAYANFIETFIAKLKLENLILMGHSFGGKISTIVASRSKKIKSLVLINASGVEKKSFASKLKITVASILKPLTSLLPKILKQSILKMFASTDYKNAGELKESFKKIVSQDVSSDAAKIDIPTTIIWGDKDQEVSVSAAKRFRSLIKNSRIKIVWNTGHNPHLEKPDKFLEIIKDNI